MDRVRLVPEINIAELVGKDLALPAVINMGAGAHQTGFVKIETGIAERISTDITVKETRGPVFQSGKPQPEKTQSPHQDPQQKHIDPLYRFHWCWITAIYGPEKADE